MFIKNLNITKVTFLLILILSNYSLSAQVGIGTTTPNASSALDIESTNSGLLIPRMTTVQRDAIETPAEGLQVFNTTRKSLDVFVNGDWKSYTIPFDSNLVYVYSLEDLPEPVSNEITLDGTKMYVFAGAVNIDTNYININGAGLRGTDPEESQVISTVGGAILRSTNKNVYMKDLATVPASSATQAFNFTDDGTHYCNIFEGSSVVDVPGIPSLGVGEISGFIAISIYKNFWNTADGLKVSGDFGKLAASDNFIINISTGAGIEILPNAIIDDIDIKSNYFIYTGQADQTGIAGIRVDPSASVDRGILTSNLFRDVDTPLDGIDSYSRGWQMAQNSGGIQNTKAFSFVYFNNNFTDATTLTPNGSWNKIQGTTILIDEERFTATDNRITYNGVKPIDAKIYASISAIATADTRYAIAIAKDGNILAPLASLSEVTNGQTFQITLNSLVDMTEGDYVEVHLLSTGGTSLVVRDLQFRVTD